MEGLLEVEQLEAELAQENARFVQAVLRRRDEKEVNVEVVEFLIRTATRVAEGLLPWGRKALALFDRGLETRDARALLSMLLTAFEACRDIAARVTEEASRVAGRTGHPFPGVSTLADLARQAELLERSIRNLHELAHRPVPAVDPALLGRGTAAYERGEAVGLKDVVARLRSRQPS
jgi:hypothetical protein